MAAGVWAQIDNGTENSSQAVISATAVAASLIQNKHARTRTRTRTRTNTHAHAHARVPLWVNKRGVRRYLGSETCLFLA